MSERAVTRAHGFPRASPLLNLHEVRGAHLEKEATSHFRVDLLVTSCGCHASGQEAIRRGSFHRGSATWQAWALKRNVKPGHTPHSPRFCIRPRRGPPVTVSSLPAEGQRAARRERARETGGRDSALVPSTISDRVQAGHRPGRTTSLTKRRLLLNPRDSVSLPSFHPG